MEDNKEKARENLITLFTTHLLNIVDYDKSGKNNENILINGFYENGIHSKTDTKYSFTGKDIDGYDIDGSFHFDRGYFVDKNGLYTEITEIDPQTNAEIIIKNYLDSNTQINQCIILENANGAINYQANLVQRIYI